MTWLEEKRRELESYLPPLTRRPDFDAFWESTLAQARAVPLRPERIPWDYPSPHVQVYDISYNGFDETRIHGWLILPVFLKQERYPCLIHYHGFTGDRGYPDQYMQWITLGMAVLAVDCREQGGATGNQAAYSSSGMVTNVVTKGILNRDEYYYRAVYMDCVKALDFAEGCLEVDPERLVIEGGSQGGALGMAVCALDARPRLGILNVPSNSNLEERVLGRHGSFASVSDYLRRHPDQVDQAFETLSYFDTMNLADRIRCPILASVGLCDPVCPAKCYFASYNRITSPKEIALYPFNEHDGAGAFHMERELRFVRDSGILGDRKG